MRILYLAYDDLSRSFAWTTHAMSVVEGLASRGHEVLLAASVPPSRSRVTCIPLGRVFLGSAAREFDPDVAYLRGVPLALAPASVRAPMVVEINGLVEHERIGIAKRWLFRQAMNYYFSRARRIVTVSETFRAGLHELHGIPLEKIAVVENGADLERFRPDVAPADRSTMGCSAGDLVGIFVGSFYPHHHLPFLVAALSRAMESEPRLRVVFVGDGVDRPAAEAVARGKRFVFLGPRPYEEIPSLLAASDLGLLALKQRYRFYGPSTIKLYEYMASAKPCVVATDLPEVAEFVSKRGIGVVTGLDEARYADAVLAVARDAGRARYGLAGRAECERHYNWDRAVGQVESLLKETAGV